MNSLIELFIQLAFETGQAYQRLYSSAGLDNVMDFNNIAFANHCGAEWNFKGDMSNLSELFKIHSLNHHKITELNKLAQQLQTIKTMAKEELGE